VRTGLLQGRELHLPWPLLLAMLLLLLLLLVVLLLCGQQPWVPAGRGS